MKFTVFFLICRDKPDAMFENIIKKYYTIYFNHSRRRKTFTDLLVCQSFPKKTVLLREGEICQFEGYIHKGCVRMYCLDDNGSEVTLLFAIEDWWISDIASFHEQKPSKVLSKRWKILKFIC